MPAGVPAGTASNFVRAVEQQRDGVVILGIDDSPNDYPTPLPVKVDGGSILAELTAIG